MQADFPRRENIQLEMTFAMVVLIEMIVLKHVVCPNNIDIERFKILQVTQCGFYVFHLTSADKFYLARTIAGTACE